MQFFATEGTPLARAVRENSSDSLLSAVPVASLAHPERKSVLIEYWAENAYPWLVGMTYKAVRTDRYKYIHWVNLSRNGELDELYDLEKDPYEIANLSKRPAYKAIKTKLQRELRRLVPEALGL